MTNKKQVIKYMSATGAVTLTCKKETLKNKILKLIKHICK